MIKRQVDIFFLHFQHVLNYRAKNFIWFIQNFINPFVLMLFWRGAVGKSSTVGGWGIEQIQSYYLLITIALVLLMTSVETVVAKKDIKEGNLAYYLLKPYSYFLIRLHSEAPWRIIQGTYGIIALIILPPIMQFSIKISSDPLTIGATVIIAMLAYLISFLYKMIIGFTAFWLTDIHAITEIQEIFALLFTGLVMPLAFMPQIIRTLAHATPLPYIIYYPVTVLLGMHDLPTILQIIGCQLIWITVLIIIYKLMWKRGLQSFTGVGQ